MPDFNIGFGSSGGGLLGGLGRSIAATLSPYRDPGIAGGIRAFLNPGTTLSIEDQQRKSDIYKQVWEQNQQAIQNAFGALESGDRNAATQIIGQVGVAFERAGIDPKSNFFPIFEEVARNYDIAHQRAMDPNKPDYLSNLGSVLTTPDQGMNLAQVMQQGKESGLRSQLTQQQIEQQGQLFPYKLEGAGLGNQLTQEQMQSEQARRAEMAQRGALLGAQTEGVGIGNQLDQEKLNYFKKYGMLPGTATQRSGTELLDDQARYADTVAKTVRLLQQGKKDELGMSSPYSPQEAEQMVTSLNAYGDQLEARTGRPQPRISIEQGQPVVRRNAAGEPISTPGGAFPRVRMGQQQPPPAPATEPPQQPFNEPLTPQAVAKIPDSQVGAVSFDETTLSADVRASLRAIRAEAQAALKAAPASQRRAVLTFYNRKILEALASGGLPNANSQ